MNAAASDSPRSGTPATADHDQIQTLLGVDLGDLRVAVEWVWERRDSLARLAERLPSVLGEAAASITDAGSGAVEAANLLGGDDGTGGVKVLAGEAAGALDVAAEQLASLEGKLGQVGTALARIKLPGLGRPLKGPADDLLDGARSVADVAATLTQVAAHLRELGDNVGAAAIGVRRLGDQLVATGATIDAFSSSDVVAEAATSTQSVTVTEVVAIGDQLAPATKPKAAPRPRRR